MPRAAKACSEPSCPRLQPCPDHQRKPWAGSTRRTELPSDWRRRRRKVLRRDPICTECQQALSREVHHTADKHNHSLEVLAGVCVPCHKKLTQEQARASRFAA